MSGSNLTAFCFDKEESIYLKDQRIYALKCKILLTFSTFYFTICI